MIPWTPRVVMTKAVELKFPLLTLILGMMVHQAGRSMKAGDGYSRTVLPAKSILAGCGLSVA